VEGVSQEGGVRKSWIEISGSGGLSVECGVLEPKDPRGTHPAIVLLGGRASGRRAIDNAPGTLPDVIVLAVDYRLDGPEPDSVVAALEVVPAVRRRIFEVPLRAILAVDYLRSRKDVDPSRVILVGFSFGALFVPCVAVEDGRFAAAVMVQGGGGLTSLIRHNLEPWTDEATSFSAAALAGLLLRPMDPERFAPRVSPVPLLLLNGTKDSRVPRRNVEALFDKAREPKKLVWLDLEHVDPKRPEIVGEIVTVLARELKALRAI